VIFQRLRQTLIQRSTRSKITSVAIAVALTLGPGCNVNCNDDKTIQGDSGASTDAFQFGSSDNFDHDSSDYRGSDIADNCL